jgi:hypothetical protein
MLVAMSFSIEILMTIVFGLSVGYALSYEPIPSNIKLERVDHANKPCCVFMEEEAGDLQTVETDIRYAS